MNFLENYPKDKDTQLRLLAELDDYLCNLTPEKVFSKRFTFLLEYFRINDDSDLKEICENWLERIHNVHLVKESV